MGYEFLGAGKQKRKGRKKTNTTTTTVLVAASYSIQQNDKIILIADDIDINVGKLLIQKSKSHGGNNGIKSLFTYINDEPLLRIRIGVGRPNIDGKASFDPEEVSKWVLSNPSKEEKENLNKILVQAILSIDTIIEFGIDFAMNKYNDYGNY